MKARALLLLLALLLGCHPPAAAPVAAPAPTLGSLIALLESKARGCGDRTGERKLTLIGREAAVEETVRVLLLDGVRRRAEGAAAPGRCVHQAMQDEVGAAPERYTLKGRPVSIEALREQGAMSRVLGLEAVYRFHLRAEVRAQLAGGGIGSGESFAQAVAVRPATFVPETQLDRGSLVSGWNRLTWWSPRGRSTARRLPDLVGELALDPASYRGGAMRVTLSPEGGAAAGLRKPTAIDGIPFAEWVEAPPESPVGQTAGGKPEVVGPPVPLSQTSQLETFY